MKIVCFLASLSQPRCIKRVKSLLEGNHEVIVYGFYRGYYDINEFPPSVKVYSWGNIQSGKGYFSRFKLIYNNIKQCFKLYKNETVLYYCFSFESALLTSIFTNSKFIYEISDLIYCYFNSKPLKYLFKAIDKFIIKKSYRTVLTSGGFYDYLYGDKKDNVAEKFIILPNKLSSYFSNIKRSELSLNHESKIRFAYIGAFRYPDTIFRFARIIGEHFPQYEFSFYGDSNLTPLAKELANKFSNIHYWGKFKNPEDLASIYNNVDVVTACYDIKDGENEKVAEPNKLYEAIGFCKPIVVSKHTYLSKRVNELNVGFTIEADNDEKIINFLKNLNIEEINNISSKEYSLSNEEFIDSPSLLLSEIQKLQYKYQ